VQYEGRVSAVQVGGNGGDIRTSLQWGQCHLGGESAGSIEAEVLLGHVMGVGREWLYAHADEPLLIHAKRRYERLIQERAGTGCPVAYLTGHKEFAGLPLHVGHGVFIPRPETEELVERVVKWWRGQSRREVSEVVIDACCGSGAIGIALAHFLDTRVVATDISRAAVRLARKNAARLGVSRLVQVHRGSLLEPLADMRPRSLQVRAVVANPPYVASKDYTELARDIVRFEPREALDGGEDGLKLIRPLIAQAETWLAAGGLLALEIGSEQKSAVLDLMSGKPWKEAYVDCDLAGLPRLALAIRAEGPAPLVRSEFG